MDTIPAIQHCVVQALSTHDITQPFQGVGTAYVQTTASSQDWIGWINLTEGKALAPANQWAAGLVTTLLSMVHSHWIHCCNILHARDAQGLRAEEAKQLDSDIAFEFLTCIDGLLSQDCDLISRGQDRVLWMTGSGERSWLSSIRIALADFGSQMTKETESMHTLMTHYFIRS
jgi:hypothetical protein